MEIRATRSNDVLAEPVLTWDTSKEAYDIDSVIHQLGGGRQTVSSKKRGIFGLATRSWRWPERPKDILFSGGTFSTTSALQAFFYQTDSIYTGRVNEAQYSIFTGMATITKDPALALQAYFTTLCAVSYYERIPLFDKAAPSSRVKLAQVIRPLGWSAYIFLTSVLVLHLDLVMLVSLLFYRARDLIRIGNAWAAFSQLLGPVTETWITNVDIVDDKTLEKWLNANGEQKTRVQLREMDGRVLVVRRNKLS